MSFQNIILIGTKERTSEIAENLQRNDRNLNIIEESVVEMNALNYKEVDLVIDTFEGESEILIERLKTIEKHISNQTLLSAFNINISTSEILQHLNNPSRFIGLHFFRLGHQTNLVEIVIPEDNFHHELLSLVSSFLEKSKFVTVKVKDRPGLLASRLLVPYLNQAAQVFDDQIATAIDIDNSVKLGLGYPKGPLQLLDEIGIDQYIAKAQPIYQEIPETKYSIPPILKRMNSTRIIGKKSKKGFFYYEKSKQYEQQY